MDKAIKVLAWYTAIDIGISTLMLVGQIGISPAYTPRQAVFTIILNAPIIVFGILVIIWMRRKD